MTDKLTFDRSHPGHYGQAVDLSPLVRRVVANNPGPFTFTGTVTHIIGRGEVAILDPGPDDPDHIAALMTATAGEDISTILVSHTHRDHTDGIEALRAMTNARVVGCAPHEGTAELNPLEASITLMYRPHRVIADGEVISGKNWTLEAVATPGHTRNHLAFALKEENALFSGDHVMAWSTTVVAPPDGNMWDYKASLRKLLGRGENLYYPAHGPSLTDAKTYTAALLAHREARERQILDALAAAESTIPYLVTRIYTGLAPSLQGAAGLSVRAHLDELVERGLVRTETGSDGIVYRRI